VRRIGRGFRDAGQRQRAAVGPAGVAVDAFEPHRPVAHDGVEFSGRRKAPQLPVFLVPAASAQPWVPRIGARVLADRLERAGQRGAVEQVELRQLLAQAEQQNRQKDDADRAVEGQKTCQALVVGS